MNNATMTGIFVFYVVTLEIELEILSCAISCICSNYFFIFFITTVDCFYNVGCCCSTCKRLCTANRLHLMPPFRHWRPALIMWPALTTASEWSICQCTSALTSDWFLGYCQCRSTLTITPSTCYRLLWMSERVCWYDWLFKFVGHVMVC